MMAGALLSVFAVAVSLALLWVLLVPGLGVVAGVQHHVTSTVNALPEWEHSCRGSAHRVLTTPMVFTSAHSEMTHRVSAGYVSDGFSQPRGWRWLLRPFYKPFDKGWQAAVLHDYLCELAGMAGMGDDKDIRRIHDKIFLEALKALGVGWFRRWLLYGGARAGSLARYKGEGFTHKPGCRWA